MPIRGCCKCGELLTSMLLLSDLSLTNAHITGLLKVVQVYWPPPLIQSVVPQCWSPTSLLKAQEMKLNRLSVFRSGSSNRAGERHFWDLASHWRTTQQCVLYWATVRWSDLLLNLTTFQWHSYEYQTPLEYRELGSYWLDSGYSFLFWLISISWIVLISYQYNNHLRN